MSWNAKSKAARSYNLLNIVATPLKGLSSGLYHALYTVFAAEIESVCLAHRTHTGAGFFVSVALMSLAKGLCFELRSMASLKRI